MNTIKVACKTCKTCVREFASSPNLGKKMYCYDCKTETWFEGVKEEVEATVEKI